MALCVTAGSQGDQRGGGYAGLEELQAKTLNLSNAGELSNYVLSLTF